MRCTAAVGKLLIQLLENVCGLMRVLYDVRIAEVYRRASRESGNALVYADDD